MYFMALSTYKCWTMVTMQVAISPPFHGSIFNPNNRRLVVIPMQISGFNQFFVVFDCLDVMCLVRVHCVCACARAHQSQSRKLVKYSQVPQPIRQQTCHQTVVTNEEVLTVSYEKIQRIAQSGHQKHNHRFRIVHKRIVNTPHGAYT